MAESNLTMSIECKDLDQFKAMVEELKRYMIAYEMVCEYVSYEQGDTPNSAMEWYLKKADERIEWEARKREAEVRQ